MAEKRMFAKSIVESDAFIDLPSNAQCLYFHLSMNADDDGFVNSPRKIARMLSLGDSEIQALKNSAFIIEFEDGVVLIKHWRINNTIRSDRYRPTEYREHLGKVNLKENGAYSVVNGIPMVNQMDTKNSIDKESEVKVSNKKFVPPTIEEVDAYIKDKGYNFDAETFVAFYESKGWKVGNQSMKNWRSACTTWSKQDRTRTTKKQTIKPEWYDKHQEDLNKKLNEKPIEFTKEETQRILEEAKDLF